MSAVKPHRQPKARDPWQLALESLTELFPTPCIREREERIGKAVCAPMPDLGEEGTQYLIKTSVPGLKKRDVKVTTEIRNGALCVLLTRNPKAGVKHLEVRFS